MNAYDEARGVCGRIADRLEEGTLRWGVGALRIPSYCAGPPSHCAIGLIQKEVSLEEHFGKATYPVDHEGEREEDGVGRKLDVALAAERLISRALWLRVKGVDWETLESNLIEINDGDSEGHWTLTEPRVISAFRRASRLR